MSLQLKINQRKDLVSSEDVEFAGTSLENTGFIFEISSLSRKQKSASIANLSNTVENMDNILQSEYNEFLFKSHVTSFSGIDIIDDNGVLVTDEQLVEKGTNRVDEVYNLIPDLLMNTIMKKIQDFTKAEEKKSEPTNEDLPITLPGQ